MERHRKWVSKNMKEKRAPLFTLTTNTHIISGLRDSQVHQNTFEFVTHYPSHINRWFISIRSYLFCLISFLLGKWFSCLRNYRKDLSQISIDLADILQGSYPIGVTINPSQTHSEQPSMNNFCDYQTGPIISQPHKGKYTAGVAQGLCSQKKI